jgi:hypothetical protein
LISKGVTFFDLENQPSGCQIEVYSLSICAAGIKQASSMSFKRTVLPVQMDEHKGSFLEYLGSENGR